jgi:nitrite reductase (NADH) small subunit
VRYDVLGVDELQPGQMRPVRVGNVAVVVIRTPAGEFRALRDLCSHYGARLSLGLLRGMVESDESRRYRLADGKYTLTCPWHGYEFDVDSGRCPADPDGTRVRAYEVTVETGRVLVER